jgi:hypothetical protein
MVFSPPRVDQVESLIPLVEPVLDERVKHAVLLIDAVEERANVAILAKSVRRYLWRVVAGFHTSITSTRREPGAPPACQAAMDDLRQSRLRSQRDHEVKSRSCPRWPLAAPSLVRQEPRHESRLSPRATARNGGAEVSQALTNGRTPLTERGRQAFRPRSGESRSPTALTSEGTPPRGFIDEVSEVGLRMGGDQDHHGRAPALLGQPLGELESAPTRERDVDEHDLRAPVMEEASLESRKATAVAISSGWPSRAMGTGAAIWLACEPEPSSMGCRSRLAAVR